jgi:hypothetical protein
MMTFAAILVFLLVLANFAPVRSGLGAAGPGHLLSDEQKNPLVLFIRLSEEPSELSQQLGIPT